MLGRTPFIHHIWYGILPYGLKAGTRLEKSHYYGSISWPEVSIPIKIEIAILSTTLQAILIIKNFIPRLDMVAWGGHVNFLIFVHANTKGWEFSDVMPAMPPDQAGSVKKIRISIVCSAIINYCNLLFNAIDLGTLCRRYAPVL